jgi:hypothetical protein
MRTHLLAPLLLALLFAAAGQTFGQIDPSALYNITAKHSGKCLDVSGGPGAVGNGARVIQWDCNGQENQKWTFTPVGDYYKIIAKHSGKSLDVFGGTVSQGDGVIVEQWDDNGADNQLWRLHPLGDDYYRIVAKHSGKSLDIDGGPGATANGAQAQQWQYVDGDNQKFRLTALTPACADDQAGSTFAGRAELIATRVSTEPFVEPISPTLDFTQCRGNMRITNFPPVTTREYDVAGGRNTTTISLTGGGTGSVSPGRGISVQVTLHFQHRLETDPRIAPLARPSDLTLTLSGTVAPGGEVTLAGSGPFVGGYLNGSTGSLRIIGTISPSP